MSPGWRQQDHALLNDVSIADLSACPDGRSILLSLSSRDIVGNTNTWKIGADGSNLKQLSKGRQEFKAECSPDSKWAYFSDNTGNRVQRVSIDGGTPETVPGADSFRTPSSLRTLSASHPPPPPPPRLDGKTLSCAIRLIFSPLSLRRSSWCRSRCRPKTARCDLLIRILRFPITDRASLPDGKSLASTPIRQNGSGRLVASSH